jgi:hypothetical protein
LQNLVFAEGSLSAWRGGRGRIDSEKDGKMAEELDHIPMPEPWSN